MTFKMKMTFKFGFKILGEVKWFLASPLEISSVSLFVISHDLKQQGIFWPYHVFLC